MDSTFATATAGTGSPATVPAKGRVVGPPRAGCESAESTSANLAEYLASTGVTEHLKKSISMVLERQPEDPMAFLADYFNDVLHKPGLVISAYNLVKHGSVLSETFADGVASAYLAFQKRARTDDDVVVRATEFAQILRSLCGKLPSSVQSRVVQELCDTRSTDVSWGAFRDGILLARAVAEFYRLAMSPWKARPADMETFDQRYGTNYADEYLLRYSDLHGRVRCLREFYARLLVDSHRGVLWCRLQPARSAVGCGAVAGPEAGGVRRVLIVVEGAVMAAANAKQSE